MIRTELDHKFEYRNNVDFGKRVLIDLIICVSLGLFTVVSTTVAVYHADNIDKFFQNLYKLIAL